MILLLLKLATEIGRIGSKNKTNKNEELICLELMDIQLRVDGSTALHLACLNGHLSLIRWLFEKKADLEKDDLKGRRAVYYAVKGSQPEVLKLLIRKGVELDPLTKKKKLSPFLKAVRKHYIDCAQILIDNNCNINLQVHHFHTCLKLFKIFIYD